MAGITDQNNNPATEIYRVDGFNVQTATSAWVVSNGIVTQVYPSTVDPDPGPACTGIYTYVNDGGTYDPVTTTTFGTPGGWVLIPTSSFFEFQQERRCTSFSAVTRASQDQIGTDTGCSDTVERTVSVRTGFESGEDCEVRSTEGLTAGVDGSNGETRNPNYIEPYSASDIAQYVDCSIDKNTGDITISIEDPPGTVLEPGQDQVFSIRLDPNQQDPVDTLLHGSDHQTVDILTLVDGIVPQGFPDAGESIQDLPVTCKATLEDADPASVTMVVTVGWVDAFGQQSEHPTSRGSVDISGITGTNYTIGVSTQPSDATITGDGIFPAREALEGVDHTVEASRDGYTTASLSFRVINTTAGSDEDGAGTTPA